MPVVDGFEILLKGQHYSNPPLFIMLTMYDDKVYLEKTLEYGAREYLTKDKTEQELLNCLTMVGQGNHYPSPEVFRHLIDSVESGLKQHTHAERRVFMLVAEYRTNIEIAKILSDRVRTIKNHRARICRKLGLSGPHAFNALYCGSPFLA